MTKNTQPYYRYSSPAVLAYRERRTRGGVGKAGAVVAATGEPKLPQWRN